MFTYTFNLSLRNNTSLKEEQTSLLFTILSLYVPPIILFIGIFGNLVSFIIFFKICKPQFCFKQPTLSAKFRTRLSSIKIAFGFNRNKRHTESNRNSLVKIRHKSSNLDLNGMVTIYMYLSLLAICDIEILLFGLLNDWIYDLSEFSLKNYSNFFCKSITYITFFSSHMSSYLIVITSFIRLVAFYSPFKMAKVIIKSHYVLRI